MNHPFSGKSWPRQCRHFFTGASADFKKADHPGYSGLAVIFLVGKHLYIINSVITKENPETKGIQEKLLNSIKVEG